MSNSNQDHSNQSGDDKLDMQSPDLVSQNFEKLAELFPNCVTESAGVNGEKAKAIDFDLLKQELNHAVVEGNKERYRLEWPGKREAIVTANLPTTKTLRPVREDSVDFDNTENIYIEGDNLEVLKLLQESYLGKIKMIYIDPPYNTGNDFVYKDNFSKDKDEDLFESGQKDELNQRLVVNPESSGRYHSDWLSMMYPRLKLARNLLREDGVIFISIDQNEIDNLKKLCDEIFGEMNFVSTVTVVRSKNGLGSKEGFATNNDFILVYKKIGASTDAFCNLMQDENYISKFDKTDEFGKFKVDGIFRKKGAGQKRTDSPGCFYPIYYDTLGKVYLEPGNLRTEVLPKLPDGGDGRWIWSKPFAQDKLHRLYASQGGTIYVKDYLADSGRMKPRSVLDKTMYTTEVATEEVKDLFTEKVFDTPKPVGLLFDLIDHGLSTNQIVLDFFSGSATTAHAVMKLNALDGGQRKFIQVQIPEEVEPDSDAFRANLKTIAEIGKERIRRAAKKIKEETGADIDYGFRVYRLDESNMQDVYYHPQDLDQGKMDLFGDNVKPDRTEDDLLAQVMLDWGLPLSLKIEQANVVGKKVFKVSENSLFACFDHGIDEEFAKEIAKEKPLRIVFKDAGFKDDTAKTNVKQLLKQLSPETEMKVL
ncbi:MAG: site-specific DNA-methyltransferase [Betaproteobacteria bacterium HGW-Betaproteobacteria-22]|nr:MAG: site-specific DNA-methyltransferase [Betaproteobacteria bacterium HGW-Betaproteobacteria-22]